MSLELRHKFVLLLKDNNQRIASLALFKFINIDLCMEYVG